MGQDVVVNAPPAQTLPSIEELCRKERYAIDQLLDLENACWDFLKATENPNLMYFDRPIIDLRVAIKEIHHQLGVERSRLNRRWG